MGTELKHGGKAYGFTVVVNTDEDPSVLAERLRIAAAGPNQNIALVAGYEVSPEEMAATTKAMETAYQKSRTSHS